MDDVLLKRAEEALERRCIREAIALFEQAESCGCQADSCAGGRWLCHMLNGDFERAWCESEAIARRGNPDPNRFWNGQPLTGKRVLIRCLHGLGDTIQFIRYAPLVGDIARAVFIEAQPNLKALLAASDLADHVFTWGEPEPAWDAQVEVIELPRIFRTTIETIPNRVPYLHPPRRERAGYPRIGVLWNASNYNPARSIPPALVRPLFSLENADVFSLQAGPERLDLDVPSLYEERHTLLETASIVQALDLVITVDTMMAHLAGALAVPVWTMLPYAADWRWMLGRADSPWYPRMRLFRQPAPGDWQTVIEQVRAEMRRYFAAGDRVNRSVIAAS
ncbi:MAG TPA: hypothetical protein VKX25_13650 [Bryobacteraceae bacterium]|jgi:hypothetical protein|nr:hypothetical protein [Bryobacteraceae bacterium]